ncbi:hypothetical protein F0P96_20180 [Hymenobacter busanensis]|uniref:Uncharacterized protein n=1 Tax=Hymenobacter busanensis TaxID=2607656 RepID=A0A7L4ZXY0_9BACT|nr:hypothetical protein [Hymenobacter busanensis]KAA9325322.1 hypothetical protein F0P96_20180 [Hymenobacter busanensis]QHJ07685.1 hypothetical protein GUY19_10460 [Hymenobacter busanensis]
MKNFPLPRFFRPALWLLPLLALLAFAGPKLKKTQIAKNLTVGVPEDFQALPDDGIAAKYPAPRKPLAVFSNPAGRVDFSVASKQTTFSNRDYALLLKLYESKLKSTYSKVDILTHDIQTINKRDFIVLEFVSSLADNRRGREMLAPLKRYELMHYCIEGDQLYVFHFISPVEEQAKYQPVAQAVMQSIQLK